MEISKFEMEVVEDVIINAAELKALDDFQLVLVGGGNAAVDFG